MSIKFQNQKKCYNSKAEYNNFISLINLNALTIAKANCELCYSKIDYQELLLRVLL